MNDATSTGDIAVVGASLAGVHAARAIRTAGHTDGLTVFGAEAHPPYDRPPLSKEILRGDWDTERTRLREDDSDKDIHWRLGTTVTSLNTDTLTLTADGAEQSFPGGIVVACGATPTRLPDAPPQGVHVVRTLDDSLALRADLAAGPAHVVVVGGGFIGGEVAASARQLGLSVTMVELETVPFARALGQTVGAALADLHRSHGVRVVTGVGVHRISGDTRPESVVLADGTELPADLVIVGLGVRPNTQWLTGSGLVLDDGIVCDATLLAATRIVAAGDVARWPGRNGSLRRLEHWDNAVRQGRYAGTRLVATHTGAPVEPYDIVPWMWSDQYDAKVHLYGDTRDHDEVVLVHGTPAEGRFVALYRRGDQLAAALGVKRNRQVATYRPLLAAGATWDEAMQTAAA